MILKFNLVGPLFIDGVKDTLPWTNQMKLLSQVLAQ